MGGAGDTRGLAVCLTGLAGSYLVDRIFMNSLNHDDERSREAESGARGSAAGRSGEHLTFDRELISAILNTVGALIVVLDHDGRIVLFNQACSRTTGYSFEEVNGAYVWESLLIPEEVKPVKGVFGELRAGLFPNQFVNYWVTKAGERRLISWSNTALTAEDGSVEYVVGTGIDITEHQMLERQLRQSQKMEAVGRLAGGVAHDFGSVLTAITGYADRARRSLDDDSQARSDIEGIFKASQSASDLIRRLLIFSREGSVEPAILDLDSVVGEMTNMLRRVIGDSIELTTTLGSTGARVKADRSQLEQVLLNLAVNARDAMPEGGALRIETDNVELDAEYTRAHTGVTPGQHVLLCVSDTGNGMDDETQILAFEPFFTTKEDGTGLGLSTVYGIVRQSGGHIWVDSTPARGTTFKVYLPRVDAQVWTGVE
jgi:PAS domain S-box-containing protein